MRCRFQSHDFDAVSNMWSGPLGWQPAMAEADGIEREQGHPHGPWPSRRKARRRISNKASARDKVGDGLRSANQRVVEKSAQRGTAGCSRTMNPASRSAPTTRQHQAVRAKIRRQGSLRGGARRLGRCLTRVWRRTSKPRASRQRRRRPRAVMVKKNPRARLQGPDHRTAGDATADSIKIPAMRRLRTSMCTTPIQPGLRRHQGNTRASRKQVKTQLKAFSPFFLQPKSR